MTLSILMLGDSVTEGWDGTEDVHEDEAYWIGQQLGAAVTNLGHGGGNITEDAPKDLIPTVVATDFSGYDVITVAYGINELNATHASLNTVEENYKMALYRIKEHNQHAIVIGILPIWGNVYAVRHSGPGGYTYDQLCDRLSDVLIKDGDLVYDWRSDPVVTEQNFMLTLADEWLHPSKDTYKIMGLRLAEFIDGAVKAQYHDTATVSTELIMLDNVWELKTVLNQNFAAVEALANQYINYLISIGMNHGQVAVSISRVESNSLNRRFRLEMLSDLRQAAEVLQTVAGLITRLGIKTPQVSVPLPITLVISPNAVNPTFTALAQNMTAIKQFKI